MSRVEETSKRPRGMVGASRPPRPLSDWLFAVARTHNPNISGITGVTKTHAVMQEVGNPTYYLIKIFPCEARSLGFVEL